MFKYQKPVKKLSRAEKKKLAEDTIKLMKKITGKKNLYTVKTGDINEMTGLVVLEIRGSDCPACPYFAVHPEGLDTDKRILRYFKLDKPVSQRKTKNKAQHSDSYDAAKMNSESCSIKELDSDKEDQ